MHHLGWPNICMSYGNLLGPITASAIVATVGDAQEFKNGRQLAAWMGLVPKQHSSGGKQSCWVYASVATLTCVR